jgi:hypothetical protein
MNLDHIFSLITFATGALFYVVFITTLRRRLRRCMVVPKKWPDGRKAHRASSRLGPIG